MHWGGEEGRTISSILGVCEWKSEVVREREGGNKLARRCSPVRRNGTLQRKRLGTHSISLDQLWYLIIIIILGGDGRDSIRTQASGRTLLSLVRLGDPPQSIHGLRSELGQDAGNELGELLLLAATVDGESVGAGGSVDCWGRWETPWMSDSVGRNSQSVGR